jgi:hypothetical protein
MIGWNQAVLTVVVGLVGQATALDALEESPKKTPV